MSLNLVPAPNYQGRDGIEQLQQVRHDLIGALRRGDWPRVRELDRICGALVERLLEAERDDGEALVQALSELKGVYANLITRCQQEVAQVAL